MTALILLILGIKLTFTDVSTYNEIILSTMT